METKPPAPITDPQHQLPPARESHKSGGGRRLIIWGIVILAFLVIFFLAFRHHDESKSSSTPSRRGATGPVTVVTATAQKGNIGVYLEAIGTVTPVYTDSITSEVTGLVNQVHYQEGQLVRKGQPLIDIDPRPFEAQLLQAEGALERDTNILAEAKMDLDRYRVRCNTIRFSSPSAISLLL
jgi:multidrug efflux system membrane fusion protein